MFIKENIMLAVAGLKSNKMRALLTMLGIIIGIASVIGVVSVGNAMTSSLTSSMSSMGATNITVNVQEKSSMTSTLNLPNSNSSSSKGTNNSNSKNSGSKNSNKNSQNNSGGAPPGGGGVPGAGAMRASSGGGMPPGGSGRQGKSSSTAKDIDLMTMEQINDLQENFSDEISSLSVSENGSSGKVKNDSTYANISTVGTNVGYKDVKNLEIAEGRYLSQNDIDGAKDVAVVSDKLASKIFGTNVDPINQDIKVYTSNAIYTYTIVGVYKYKASGGNRTTSDENLTTDLYIPVTVTKKTATNKNYQTFQIKAKMK